jgi:hypothetical protein
LSCSDADFVAACAALAARARGGEALPAALGAAALTLGALAYGGAAARGEAVPPALAGEVPATEVVVSVSAMLRAAGLNSFDLAMWFHRAAPSA